MYLKAINLKGFKSFPDRTRLTFSPGVSVIVGPNGSGKSNITDAVLWALGEQSPSAIRGQQMRDVIFAGGNGQSARRFAEVEVVIDNSEGRAASEFSEISISRRIERNGDGEYRLNGARCRLTDVVEALSDTNMGREAHSVISQGKVEEIVSSKPRDRRLLIEEAAGLGKHRKRRHSAQLKLDRTRDNLERAHDVEREARSHLRPLKRQAEAAERTAKLVRQANELRAQIVADDLRAQQEQLMAAEAKLAEVRATRDSVEKRFEEVRARRTAIEERLAAGEEGRRRHGEQLAEARAATERVRARAESLDLAERDLRGALGERQLRLDALEEEPEETAEAARIAELQAELERLGADPSEEGEHLRREAEVAEQRRAAAKAALEPLERAEDEIGAALRQATQMHERARAEAQKASERRAALAGELAAVEAKLAAAAVEGEHEALAGMIETGSGLERALSAVLGERLRASIVGSVGEGRERLAGADGAARALLRDGAPMSQSPSPKDGARRLLDLIEARGDAGPITERLLSDAWLVDDFDGIAEGFAGVAVTVDGECLDAAVGEIRRLPREGTDPALAARSERGELASRLAQREQTEERSRNDLQRAEVALAEARSREEESQSALRDARRALDQAAEEASRTSWLAERHAERDGEGSGTAIQRAKLEAELAAEQRHAESAETARRKRLRDREELERRIELESETLPALGRARACAAPPCRPARAARGSAGVRRRGGARGRRRSGASRMLPKGVRPPGRAPGGERGDDGCGGRGDPAPGTARREHGRAPWSRGRSRRGARRGHGAPPRGGSRRDRGQARPAGAQPRADRPGQPAGRARVRGGAGARHRARRAAQGPGVRDHGAARADPAHGPRDHSGVRGDLRGRGPRLRGDGGRAVPGREGEAAPRRRRRSSPLPSPARRPSPMTGRKTTTS